MYSFPVVLKSSEEEEKQGIQSEDTKISKDLQPDSKEEEKKKIPESVWSKPNEMGKSQQ